MPDVAGPVLQSGILGTCLVAVSLFALRVWNRLQVVQEERVKDLRELTDRYHNGMQTFARILEARGD